MQPLVDGYDDFRLRIDRREGLPYHVLASTRSAEAAASFEAPFADGELDRFALRTRRGQALRGAGGSALDDARRIGGALFTALFHDRVYGLYRDALAQARPGIPAPDSGHPWARRAAQDPAALMPQCEIPQE